MTVDGWGPFARFEISGSKFTVVLSFNIWNTTGGTVSNARVVSQRFYKAGARGERWSSPVAPPMHGALNAQNMWVFNFVFELPSNVLSYQDIGLLWECHFEGFQPMSRSGLAVLRGFFIDGWH